jgi:hypothetical protein
MSNLSFSLLEKYLGFVLDSGLVRPDGSRYALTASGREFLVEYEHFHVKYVRAQNMLEALSSEQERLVRLCQNPRLGSSV